MEKDSASSRSIPVALAPKIIQYNGGVAITAQDAVTKRDVMESLQWRSFMKTAELRHSLADDANKAAAWLAIQRLYTSLPIEDGLAILRGGEPKGVKVVAEVALPAGAMVLPPLLQGSNRIVCHPAEGGPVEEAEDVQHLRNQGHARFSQSGGDCSFSAERHSSAAKVGLSWAGHQ